MWLATGHTEMRRGFPGLALQVQEVLKRDPLSGHLFVFRERRGDLIRVIWHDGDGACLFTKRLERAADFYGRSRLMARYRSRRPNSASEKVAREKASARQDRWQELQAAECASLWMTGEWPERRVIHKDGNVKNDC